jgi:opacity protein-like surface antigen
MERALLLVAVLVSLMCLIPNASAQGKNELTAVIGRTFVSDHAPIDTNTPGTLLTSKAGLSLEANYGRHLIDLGLIGLTAEVPFVANFGEDVQYNLNLVPRNYKSFFATPSLRANIFPGSGLSPWVSAGGGVGYFKSNSTLEFGGPNPDDTGKTTAVFQAGIGLDVKLFSHVSVRGEARDFFSGVPPLNVDIGKSRQHNFFVGGGAVLHF